MSHSTTSTVHRGYYLKQQYKLPIQYHQYCPQTVLSQTTIQTAHTVPLVLSTDCIISNNNRNGPYNTTSTVHRRYYLKQQLKVDEQGKPVILRFHLFNLSTPSKPNLTASKNDSVDSERLSKTSDVTKPSLYNGPRRFGTLSAKSYALTSQTGSDKRYLARKLKTL